MAATEGRSLRQNIRVAAEKLFIEHGYHGLSMRQIAEAVGVTKAALYYHYRDKEELFLEILEAYLEDMEGVIGRARGAGKSGREQIRGLAMLILGQPETQRALMRLASQELAALSGPGQQRLNLAYHQKFLDPLAELLGEAIRRDEFRPMDPSVAMWTLLGMMYPYFYPAHSGDAPAPAEVLDQIVTIYLDGIAMG